MMLVTWAWFQPFGRIAVLLETVGDLARVSEAVRNITIKPILTTDLTIYPS